MAMARFGKSAIDLDLIHRIVDNSADPTIQGEHKNSVTVYFKEDRNKTFYGPDAEALRKYVARIPEA